MKHNMVNQVVCLLVRSFKKYKNLHTQKKCIVQTEMSMHLLVMGLCTLAVVDPLFLVRRVNELRPNTFSMAAAVANSVWDTRDGRRNVVGHRLGSASAASAAVAVVLVSSALLASRVQPDDVDGDAGAYDNNDDADADDADDADGDDGDGVDRFILIFMVPKAVKLDTFSTGSEVSPPPLGVVGDVEV